MDCNAISNSIVPFFVNFHAKISLLDPSQHQVSYFVLVFSTLVILLRVQRSNRNTVK